MKVFESTLEIGVQEPFEVLNISDTHMALGDLRDGERKAKLAETRSQYFPEAERVLELAAGESKERNIPILHTGDLLDFVSTLNLERVKRFTDENDVYAVAGNHEFSLYVGEAKEDAAYRNQSLALVQSAFKNDIRTDSRVIGGVNFVVLDNGYYCFEQEQFDFLKKQVEKNLPIVLMMHVPLYEPRLFEIMMGRAKCAYIAGVPEELTVGYPPERYEQQKADELTLEVIDYIKNQPLIKALITGHLHFNYEGVFGDRIPQIITALNEVRRIRIV